MYGKVKTMTEVERPQPAEFLSGRKVFFVGSPEDETVLIAVHPRYQEETRTLTWWDTVKERGKEVKAMQVGKGPVLQVVDVENNTYFFVPLSLPFYNNMVKDKFPEKGEFATEEEMVEAFEETMRLYQS